MGKKPKLI